MGQRGVADETTEMDVFLLLAIYAWWLWEIFFYLSVSILEIGHEKSWENAASVFEMICLGIPFSVVSSWAQGTVDLPLMVGFCMWWLQVRCHADSLRCQPSFFHLLPQRPAQDTSSVMVLSLGRILWKIISCLSILKTLVQYRGRSRFFSCVKKKKLILHMAKFIPWKLSPKISYGKKTGWYA